MATGTSETPAQNSQAAQKRSFISESMAELRKVSYPTREETIRATIMTFTLVVAFAAVLAVLDWVFKNIMWGLV